jgi:hypothetical protein
LVNLDVTFQIIEANLSMIMRSQEAAVAAAGFSSQMRSTPFRGKRRLLGISLLFFLPNSGREAKNALALHAPRSVASPNFSPCIAVQVSPILRSLGLAGLAD